MLQKNIPKQQTGYLRGAWWNLLVSTERSPSERCCRQILLCRTCNHHSRVMGGGARWFALSQKWHQRPIEVFPWRSRSGKEKLIPARIPINCSMALSTKLDNWSIPKTCLNHETRDTEGDGRICTYNCCGCNSKEENKLFHRSSQSYYFFRLMLWLMNFFPLL